MAVQIFVNMAGTLILSTIDPLLIHLLCPLGKLSQRRGSQAQKTYRTFFVENIKVPDKRLVAVLQKIHRFIKPYLFHGLQALIMAYADMHIMTTNDYVLYSTALGSICNDSLVSSQHNYKVMSSALALINLSSEK